MKFPERELTSYAEPIKPSELKQREAYFSVQYVDSEMLIPVLETWIYAGRGLDTEDSANHYYFQDVESYRQGLRWDSARAGDAQFQLGSENSMKHIFDYERALEELMKCSLRRRKSQ